MDDPEYWLFLAKDARARAASSNDSRLRDLLLGMAEDYLWLAAYTQGRYKAHRWFPAQAPRKIVEKADVVAG